MSDQPLVSVVIPCYNHEQFVQDCIQSVIDQTYQNIELIIIDDGSSDRSVEKIQEMVDSCKERFTHFEFRHRPNKGLSATLNESLEWCQGEYYCPFASDDIMIKNKILLQLEYLRNHDQCAGVFGAFEVIDQNSQVLTNRRKRNRGYTFKDIFLHQHELPAPTQMLRMNIVREVGGYKNDILIEDWYMWLKISKLGYSLDFIDVVFAMYRRHENNTSNKLELIAEGRKQIIALFKDSKFVDEAYLFAYLVSANEYLYIDINKSWNFYVIFIKNKKNLFSLSSFKYLFKFILRIIK